MKRFRIKLIVIWRIITAKSFYCVTEHSITLKRSAFDLSLGNAETINKDLARVIDNIRDDRDTENGDA